MSEIPAYVDRVLQEWHTIAFTAYDGYERVAHSVGWSENVAWDIYLFYKPNVEWKEILSKPNYWTHQLKDDWATGERYRTGGSLRNDILNSMVQLLSD